MFLSIPYLWYPLHWNSCERLKYLCSANNLLWIWEGDEWKTAFSTTFVHFCIAQCHMGYLQHLQYFTVLLHCFISWVNLCYRRFIRHFSSIASLLASLLKKAPKKLQWNPWANQAFERLKEDFIIVPILKHPDPSKAFNCGGGRLREWNRSHTFTEVWREAPAPPCLLLLVKLFPTEHNFDVGNRKLLVVKLALVVWCHWLERSLHPFTILTDHKNLEYIKTAKRLYYHQAQ